MIRILDHPLCLLSSLRKRWLTAGSIVQWLLIFLISIHAAVAFLPPARGQFSLGAPSGEVQAQTKPWWDLNKARRCGKLWCSDVVFRQFPLSRFFDDFTVATQPQTDKPLPQVIEEAESRAETVEETFYAILDQIVKYQVQQVESDRKPVLPPYLERQTRKWSFWLVTNEKPTHPLVPKVAIGIKNEQTVIFVPNQPDLGLTQQTLITITQPDSIHNGLSIEDLGEQWRELIQTCISEALWGRHFDYLLPWARPLLITVLLILTLVPIFALSGMRQFLRGLDRKVRQRLNEIAQAVREEKIAAYSKNVVGIAAETLNAENSADIGNVEASVTAADQTPVHSEPVSPIEETVVAETAVGLPAGKPLILFQRLVLKVQKFITERVQELIALPQRGLKHQNLLKQLHNLLQLLLRLLFMTRLVILMLGVVLITVIHPETRLQAVFLLKQAIVIPLIWVSVVLADLIMSFAIDHYLNQWALDAQLTYPQSKRYSLRVSTYSPVLKGASSFVFTLLGLYLTILVLGIDTSFLAGAGVAAIAIGFLSRNLLEDMLNGILILWTDRYAIGDVISVANVGGFVEDMNLYTTQLRGPGGRLTTIPNGQVRLVENLTKDWSRVEFKIEIALTVDARQAMDIIEQVAAQMQSDPNWQDFILEPASILGVDQVSHTGTLIQVWIKTQAMKQWAVGREFRLRVKQAFDQAGIALGIPQREILHRDQPLSEDSIS